MYDDENPRSESSTLSLTFEGRRGPLHMLQRPNCYLEGVFSANSKPKRKYTQLFPGPIPNPSPTHANPALAQHLERSRPPVRRRIKLPVLLCRRCTTTRRVADDPMYTARAYAPGVAAHYPFAPPHTVPPPPLGARAQLSAHDAAADLLRSSLAHRLGAQVDVDHQHRRVVLEPPKPGRRVHRSQRGQRGVSGAVGRVAPNMPRSPPNLPHPCHDSGAY